jgi:hypothetical protein
VAIEVQQNGKSQRPLPAFFRRFVAISWFGTAKTKVLWSIGEV